jgi:hypothetical protein
MSEIHISEWSEGLQWKAILQIQIKNQTFIIIIIILIFFFSFGNTGNATSEIICWHAVEACRTDFKAHTVRSVP